MTKDEMRVAIAESLGWKKGQHFEQRLSTGEGELWDGWIDPSTDEWHPEPPNYPEDLNATHEVEEALKPAKLGNVEPDSPWPIFVTHLSEITQRDGGSNIHATAAQRAEAYLRTKGLWKE